MNESTPNAATQRESPPAKKTATDTRPRPARAPSIIVGLVMVAVAGLSIWYLVRPEPLLVQGEVDATRSDIAARVDGRVGEIPVERGQNVAAGAVLVKIDNPETIAKHEQAQAAKIVAEAQLANINAGTRAEVIAARKAALERAQASVVLAQTPQGFRYEVIRKIFDEASADGFMGTDEASLAERAGHEVAVVMGSPRNIKITTPADMELAEFYLGK